MPRIDLKAADGTLVSIHAPRCRGAMRAGVPAGTVVHLVSIHAPRCRGAMQILICADDDYLTVSIHAPRCRGAMRTVAVPLICDSLFQSTPPVAEGRCRAEMWHIKNELKVSIHAPRCRGAMLPGRHRRNGQRRFQSTPPVAEGRCNRRRGLIAASGCFNPRPPLPRGDASAP